MRRRLAPRRAHITQKVRIGGTRTLYLAVDNETAPLELFLRIKGDEDGEKVLLYDVIARLVSLALQEGIAIAEIAGRLHGTRCHPAGPVELHDRIKFCDGTIDFIGRHLLVTYCKREDLAHVKEEP
jgi:ribonucleoside-diphosphate reductase alpha chain